MEWEIIARAKVAGRGGPVFPVNLKYISLGRGRFCTRETININTEKSFGFDSIHFSTNGWDGTECILRIKLFSSMTLHPMV